MAVATVFGPARRTEFGGRSWVDLRWGNDRAEAARKAREAAAAFDAEQAIGEGRFDVAVTRLCAVNPTPGSYPRTLLIRALRDGGDWARAVDVLTDPADADELVLVVKAQVMLGNHGAAASLLHVKAAAVGMTQPAVGELDSWIEAQRKLTQ
jgi:hypothetical protein